MFSDTFTTVHSRPLQIILYDGPPKPKQTSQPKFLKTLSKEVEIVDLTCSGDEGGTCKLSNSGGETGNIGSDDGVSITTWEGVSMPISREDAEDNALHQPTPSQGNTQETTADIDGELEVSNSRCPQEDEMGSYIDYQPKVLSISTSECLPDIEHRPHCYEPRSTSSGSPTSIKQPAREASDRTTRKPTTFHSQPLIQERAEIQGQFPGFQHMSDSSEPNHNDNDKKNKKPIWPTRKQKRPILAMRDSRTSTETSKQRLQHTARLASQQNPLPSCDKPVFISDDSSDDIFDEDRHRTDRLKSNKRPRLISDLYCGSTNEDDEYEVEKILDARVNRKKLQYRVKWLGYEDNMKWYNAANFKNCPYKLRSFHTANPLCSGPPKMLAIWVQCWEQDRDADKHLDDDKPER